MTHDGVLSRRNDLLSGHDLDRGSREAVRPVDDEDEVVADPYEDVTQDHSGQLASYKQPRRLEIVAELPRTPATGQVQRPLLVERISAG